MDSNNFRNSYDWKLFWLIEKQNIDELKKLCVEMVAKNQNILVYFDMTETKFIFTQDEIDKMNVNVFDIINFSPIQHTWYLNWYEGSNCLLKYNIGTKYRYGMSVSRFKNK